MEGRVAGARDYLQTQKKALAHVSPQAKLNNLRLQNDALREKMTAPMRHLIQQNKARLLPAKRQVPDAMHTRIARTRHAVSLRAERLNGVSPLLRLRAGYGYLTDGEEKRIRSVTQIKSGDTVHIYLTDGRADTEVRSVETKAWEKETAK